MPAMELNDIFDEMKPVARTAFVLVIGNFVAIFKYQEGIFRRDSLAGIEQAHLEGIPRFR